MKIRNGFVSNSSSSSFCIYGATITFEKARNNLKFIIKDDEKYDDNLNYSEYDILELLNNNLPNKLQCEYISMWENSEFYVGRSWSSIGDNETGKEFKTIIEKTITECFGEGHKCSTHEEAWTDN